MTLTCPCCGSNDVEVEHDAQDWYKFCRSCVCRWNQRRRASQAEADRRDALRYRKLRERLEPDARGPHGGWPNPGVPIVGVIGLVDGRRYPQSVSCEELDRAVDAMGGTDGSA